MKIHKLTILYIFYALFNCFHLNATPKNKYVIEEVSVVETSSFFLVKRDSVFFKGFQEIQKDYKKENYAKALKSALALFDKSNTDDNLFDLKILIADIYSKSNNHNKALNTYKEALAGLKNYNPDNNSDFNFAKRNEVKLNLRIANSFHKLSLKDSAKHFYKKVEETNVFDKEILKYKAIAFASLSGIYQLDSIYGKAIDYAKKAIEINKKINSKLSETLALNNLGSIYLSQNNFELAKETYLLGIDIIKNDNSQKAVVVKAGLYYNLAWAMRNLKEYEAYDYQELSYEIENGLRDKEVRRAVEEVNAKYNIDVVKKEEENKRLKQKTNFFIYAAAGLLIILFLLYFLHIYKLKQKNLRLQLSQTHLLQNQKLEKLKAEVRDRVLNATIDGKETERKEIAETLHDSVSALLSSANLHLIAAKQYFNKEIPVEITKSQTIITEASKKIRDLSHTLVSSVLLKFGLKTAINDLVSKYSNTNLALDSDISNIRRYQQNFEIKMYNITQECLNNILKHSKATKASIYLTETNNQLHLKITDNGVGFDKNKPLDNVGLGLSHIESRVLLMKGKFFINSSIGKGTSITLQVPVMER